RAVLPRSKGRTGTEKEPPETIRKHGKITPFTGRFEMPFGATSSGLYMPTPGGRITPTRDSYDEARSLLATIATAQNIPEVKTIADKAAAVRD
ncbi:MAG: hypothetical protein H0U56_13260, partial [Methylibium sp.]|uniref:hypothetical protein n=1 Tax=Methylibium sp. TaxID=2067992 RepID=UPI0017C78462